MTEEEDLIKIDSMSIDQFAGSVVLILGAVGSLLLVIWQSRCACRFRLGCSDKCYVFDCARDPPPPADLEETDSTKNVPSATADAVAKGTLNKNEEILKEEIIIPVNQEPEPEPAPDILSGKRSKRSLNNP